MRLIRKASPLRQTSVLLVAVLAAATACSSSGNKSGGSTGSAATGGGCSAPSTVVFADNHPINVLAVGPVAQGTGAFDALEKECHTTVKVVYYGNGGDIMNALVGGQADIADSSAGSFAKVAAQGKQVQVIFSAFVGGGAVVIAQKKYESTRGDDISKFAGSTFGYPDASGACAFFDQALAAHSGLDWNKQKKVAFGANSAAPVTLASGRVDILCTDPSTAAAAVQAGTAYVVFNTNDKATTVPILGFQLGGVYGVNKSFVDKYPVLTQKLVDAFLASLKAIQAVATDPAKVLALYPTAAQGPLQNGWAQSWPLVAPAITENDGSLPQQGIDDTLAFDQKFGLLTADQVGAARAMFNNTFIEKAKQGS
jgi:ABC-type nitrate/sulfonate/bicarbonate transport system substrate-binding protein